MRRSSSILGALAREQSGWTLTELLVAAVIGLAVIGSATAVFTSAIRSQPRTSSRGADVQQARHTMERITRELRQGRSIYTATPSQLSILTYVQKASCGGGEATTARACRVTYTCTATSCSRVEANPDGTGAGTPTDVVSGIAGPAVFSYSPSAAGLGFVGVSLIFPANAGDDAITLSDGVALRLPVPL